MRGAVPCVEYHGFEVDMSTPALTLPEAREQVRELATLFHAPAQHARGARTHLPGQDRDLIGIAAHVIRKADDLLESLMPLLQTAPETIQDELTTLQALTQALRDAAFLLMQKVNPDQAWFWTRSWQAGEREADADYAAGRFRAHDSTEAFLAALEARE
jgi:hypothetical protein